MAERGAPGLCYIEQMGREVFADDRSARPIDEASYTGFPAHEGTYGRGNWMYLNRAADKVGNTLDFMLSAPINGPAVTRFFAKALSSNCIPRKTAIDKSGPHAAGNREENRILKRFGCPAKVQTIWSRFLNNMIEQNHRSIKRRVRHMCGFKPLSSASATLDGIEVANMIRKRQLPSAAMCGLREFAEIAG